MAADEVLEGRRGEAARGQRGDPKLLERILDDFDKCGVVGERTNKLVGYLAATSRKLDAPLAVVIQSSSAAGKSSLMDAVLNLMPEEERTQYSAMTGQSLFYMGEADIQHKILAIVAYFAHRDHPFRGIVITRFGQRDRSEATQAGRQFSRGSWSCPFFWSCP